MIVTVKTKPIDIKMRVSEREVDILRFHHMEDWPMARRDKKLTTTANDSCYECPNCHSIGGHKDHV